LTCRSPSTTTPPRARWPRRAGGRSQAPAASPTSLVDGLRRGIVIDGRAIYGSHGSLVGDRSRPLSRRTSHVFAKPGSFGVVRLGSALPALARRHDPAFDAVTATSRGGVPRAATRWRKRRSRQRGGPSERRRVAGRPARVDVIVLGSLATVSRRNRGSNACARRFRPRGASRSRRIVQLRGARSNIWQDMSGLGSGARPEPSRRNRCACSGVAKRAILGRSEPWRLRVASRTSRPSHCGGRRSFRLGHVTAAPQIAQAPNAGSGKRRPCLRSALLRRAVRSQPRRRYLYGDQFQTTEWTVTRRSSSVCRSSRRCCARGRSRSIVPRITWCVTRAGRSAVRAEPYGDQRARTGPSQTRAGACCARRRTRILSRRHGSIVKLLAIAIRANLGIVRGRR